MLAQPMTRIGLAVATYGAAEIASAGVDAAIKAGAKELESAAEEFWKREDGRRAAMEQLKNALIEMTKNGKGESPPCPLVIVVDELDRCRPDYALAMLEVVKHFFAVPHVHFVLGVNSNALQNSVKARYGTEIDAEAYLSRFINLTMSLPKVVNVDPDRPVQLEYLQQTAKEMGLGDKITKALVEHLSAHIRSHSPSIRDVGRVLSYAVLISSNMRFDELSFGKQTVVVTLLLSRVLYPDLYWRIVEGVATLDEVQSFYAIEAKHISPQINGERNVEYDRISAVILMLWGYVVFNGSQRGLEDFSSAFNYHEQMRPSNLPREVSMNIIEAFELKDM